MIIAFEGADLTGKTTLLAEYRKLVPIPYVHQDFKTGIPTLSTNAIEERALSYIDPLVQLASYDFIVDRFLMSSFVYCKAYGRNYDLRKHMEYVRKLIDARQIVWIVTCADDAWNRSVTRAEDLVSRETHRLVCKLYENEIKHFTNLGARVIRVDTTEVKLIDMGLLAEKLVSQVHDACESHS